MRVFVLIASILLFCSSAFAERMTETVVVGVGTTKQQALQNAFDTGLKQLKGVYIGTVERFKDGAHSRQETIELTQGSLDQYKILEERFEGDQFFLKVYLTVRADDPLKKLLSDGYKPSIDGRAALNLAAFQQSRLANAKKLIDVMFEPEFFWSNAYQFKIAGPAVVQTVGAESTSGYIPIWIGRNPTFWLELYDILKAVESKQSDSSYGWYSSAFEHQLWADSGETPLPFDLEQWRIADGVSSVSIPKDLRDGIRATDVTLSFPGSQSALKMFFDRNLMVAGYKPEMYECQWFIGDRDFVPLWFLAPRWTDIASNQFVLSAPPGTALYISPGSKSYGAYPDDMPTMNYRQIYRDSENETLTGDSLVRNQSGRYRNWGDDMPIATTGLGFVVKVPFETSNPAGLMSQIEKLQIRQESGARDKIIVTL